MMSLSFSQWAKLACWAVKMLLASDTGVSSRTGSLLGRPVVGRGTHGRGEARYSEPNMVDGQAGFKRNRAVNGGNGSSLAGFAIPAVANAAARVIIGGGRAPNHPPRPEEFPCRTP